MFRCLCSRQKVMKKIRFPGCDWEQIFHFEYSDLNELSRNIMADWVLVLENSGFEYEIEIPEPECSMRIDPNAYIRILNNLLKNVIGHSKSDQITFPKAL